MTSIAYSVAKVVCIAPFPLGDSGLNQGLATSTGVEVTMETARPALIRTVGHSVRSREPRLHRCRAHTADPRPADPGAMTPVESIAQMPRTPQMKMGPLRHGPVEAATTAHHSDPSQGSSVLPGSTSGFLLWVRVLRGCGCRSEGCGCGSVYGDSRA